MIYSHLINEKETAISDLDGEKWYNDEDDDDDYDEETLIGNDLTSKVVLSSSTSESEVDNDNQDIPDNSFYYSQPETQNSEEETEKINNDLRRIVPLETTCRNRSQLSSIRPQIPIGNKSSTEDDEMDDKSRKFHLYITSFQMKNQPKVELNADKFKMAMSASLCLPFRVVESRCGLLVTVGRSSDIDKILKTDLSSIFGGPIQLANLSKNERPFKRKVFFKTIPWAITLKEVRFCLEKQGIRYGRIKRIRNVVKVEVLNACHEERLLKEGLNFYNAVSFSASGDVPPLRRNNDRLKSRDIIQCYKCQGFWHTATSCKNEVRCVRCGDHHEVDKCSKPKSDPTCCNCRGSHHAAYKMCPARLKMLSYLKLQDNNNNTRQTDFLVRASTS